MAQAERPSVTVTIDAKVPGAQIDPDIYGQFAEHKGTLIYDGIWVGKESKIPNTRGIRNDVVAALRKIHVPVVRWPGGCFADAYHWRDGIGSKADRHVRTSVYGQLETNQFGTHEFMDFAEQIGAEAYVSINVGSGTVQEAADWIAYMTEARGSLADLRRANGRDKPWKVKYVGIGNEMWQCGGNMRPDYYIDQLRQYSQFVSYDIFSHEARYIASGPGNDDYEWTEKLMQNVSWTYPHSDLEVPFFQGLSLHYYTFPEGGWVPEFNNPHRGGATGFSEDQWFSTLRTDMRIEELITRNSALMDRYDAQKKVALVVDEWGAWYAPDSEENPDSQQNSLRDALLAALTFNVFHRHSDRVKMANISMLINVFQAMILTDHEKMLLTPTYHVFDMYQPFRGARSCAVRVEGPRYLYGSESLPTVDVSAAKGNDGKFYLAMVNLDPHRAADIATNLSGQARGRIITGPQMDSHNTFGAPDVVRPIPYSGSKNKNGRLSFLLPAKSVAVVTIE